MDYIAIQTTSVLCRLQEEKCISKHDLIMLRKDLEYSDHGEGSMEGN